MAKQVTLVEVGLRDGLQNESVFLSKEVRVELAKQLADAGLKNLEVGAFVNPQWVPQMADSKSIIQDVLLLQKKGVIPAKVKISALVPNEKGMLEALSSGVKEVAIFAACSESFSKKNINCTIAESFQRFESVVKVAKKNKIKVRGYLSTVFGCPYEGEVSSKIVLANIKRMLDLGVYEISLGDTIGVATPGDVEKLLKKILAKYPAKLFAGHFHDTRGTALANIIMSYQMGLRVFDTSVGGLGGCPYAPGAAGNVATEDVVYLFEKMGVRTGTNLEKLVQINRQLNLKMGKELSSKVSRAGGFLKPKNK